VDESEPIEPFLLHPSSAEFLRGARAEAGRRFEKRLDALDVLLLLGSFISGLFVLVTLVQAGNDFSNGRDPSARAAGLALGLLMLGVIGGLYLSGVQRARARRRLVNEGQILTGTLVACRDEPFSASEHETAVFRVEVDYAFTTPRGQELVDHDEAVRDDLGTLPEPGTPVRVLFLNESCYALL
jgi:hypothetical protein